MKKIIIEALLAGFIFLALSYSFVYYHEEVHRTVYEKYGIDAKTFITPFYGYTERNETQFEELCENSPSACRDVIMLQALTEIIGYHAIPIFGILAGMLILMILKSEES